MAKPMKRLELHYPMNQFLLKGFTRIKKGLPGLRRDYKGCGFTRVYQGLKGFTRVYKGIQGITRVYKGLQGYTRV